VKGISRGGGGGEGVVTLRLRAFLAGGRAEKEGRKERGCLGVGSECAREEKRRGQIPRRRKKRRRREFAMQGEGASW
jgi:hypothetical protein